MLEKLQTIHQMAPNIILSRTDLEKVLQIPYEEFNRIENSHFRRNSVFLPFIQPADTSENNDVHLVARGNLGISCIA